MKVLVINCGSTSLKYTLFQNKTVLIDGDIERISDHKSVKNHTLAFKNVINILKKKKIIDNINNLSAISHRVVHGGKIKKSSIINANAIKTIAKYCDVAPLHNPHSLKVINYIHKKYKKVKQIAVFDTAFHHTIPEYAKVYSLPIKYYKKYGIQRYGFHGISHQYMAIEASKILKKPLSKLNLVTCHLGAGCSITAIKKGKSIDTTMGFTPLEGVAMVTRSGSIDPGIIFYLYDKLKLSLSKIKDIINNKSGIYGLSHLTKNMSTIIQKSKSNKDAKLALDIFCYEIRGAIASFIGIMNEDIDAIVYAGGIGENNPKIRELCSNINKIKIDKTINNKNKDNSIISKRTSKIKVISVKTNEELMILKETIKLIK